MNLGENQLQLFGSAIIFYVALGFSSFFERFTREAKEKLSSSLLTFGIAQEAGSGKEALKDNPAARDGVKTFLFPDSYVFVPLYLGFLFLMSYFLSHSSFLWARYVALAVVFCAIVGAAADWTENLYSYKALESSNSGLSADLMFWAANVKWILFLPLSVFRLCFSGAPALGKSLPDYCF